MEIIETANAKKATESTLNIVIAERVSVQMNLSRKQAAIVAAVIATLLGSPRLPEFIANLSNLLSKFTP